jgi:hypothetical protein
VQAVHQGITQLQVLLSAACDGRTVFAGACSLGLLPFLLLMLLLLVLLLLLLLAGGRLAARHQPAQQLMC